MKIGVLWAGCPKCIQETNITKIAGYNFMSTPAIVVNGKVIAPGRIPETKEIMVWLK